jgi:hypothetical protein
MKLSQILDQIRSILMGLTLKPWINTRRSVFFILQVEYEPGASSLTSDRFKRHVFVMTANQSTCGEPRGETTLGYDSTVIKNVPTDILITWIQSRKLTIRVLLFTSI